MASIIQTVDGVVTNKFTLSAKLSFGRTTDNTVQIDDLAVSNTHANIICESDADKDNYYLVDLDSTNGSFINEKQIKKQQLHHKDSLRIGWNVFTFIDENEVDLERTSKIKKSWIPGVYFSK
ncbi:MAG: FHA domain-containing protein [Gammaproteobacteria bacterium]|nr:FHA domain-containing protein [Gammaproteobacteria bacterium]